MRCRTWRCSFDGRAFTVALPCVGRARGRPWSCPGRPCPSAATRDGHGARDSGARDRVSGTSSSRLSQELGRARHARITQRRCQPARRGCRARVRRGRPSLANAGIRLDPALLSAAVRSPITLGLLGGAGDREAVDARPTVRPTLAPFVRGPVSARIRSRPRSRALRRRSTPANARRAGRGGRAQRRRQRRGGYADALRRRSPPPRRPRRCGAHAGHQKRVRWTRVAIVAAGAPGGGTSACHGRGAGHLARSWSLTVSTKETRQWHQGLGW